MSPAAAVDISASATWMDNGEKTRLLPVAAVSAEMRLRRRAASAACPAWQVLVASCLLFLDAMASSICWSLTCGKLYASSVGTFNFTSGCCGIYMSRNVFPNGRPVKARESSICHVARGPLRPTIFHHAWH